VIEDEALVWVLSRTQHCEKVRGVFYINIQIINFLFINLLIKMNSSF